MINFNFFLCKKPVVCFSNEDTDRMVESDPRIVLRPLNPPTHEDT